MGSRNLEVRLLIEAFIQEYVVAHGGTHSCRFGGCFDFVEAFMQHQKEAEMWESVELDTTLPLVPTFQQVQAAMRETGAYFLEELGSLGTHAVCCWNGFVFDAAGISTFEEISNVFGLQEGKCIWARTC